MIVDGRSVPDGERLETDVCVIGGGAAGITLALALTDRPIRIVLLESGGLDFDAETQSLYDGRSTGLPYFPLETSRLRFFGGSTNHWGGVCRPLDPIDFEPREWIPFSGWPIRRADLDPYYPEAAEIVGLTSDDFSVESWDLRDRFSPLDLGPRTTPRIAQLVAPDDRSFGTRYRDEIDRARNVRTFLHANVTEIETDAEGGTVTEARVATLSGNRFSVEARQFVLAAGGIENPRLLLASNRHQPQGLGNQNDLVGRFFIEHPRFAAGVLAPGAAELEVGFYEAHQVDGVEVQGYVAFPEEVQREEQLVDVQVFVEPTYNARFESAFDSEDVNSLRALSRGEGSIGEFGENLMNVVGDLMTFREFTVPGAPLPVPYPEIAEDAVSGAEGLRDHVPDVFGDVAALGYKRLEGTAPVERLELVTRIDQVPNPDSRVTLAAARDELGMPRAQLDWRLSPEDRRSAVRAIEILGAGFARAGLGRVQATFDEAAPWPDDLEGGNHHMGTTRMSDDPKRGVVDGDCRVRGISNLFVAGSSVFATGGSSTPTLTLVALALRLADHLKRGMG